MAELSIDKRSIISSILKSPHGKLVEYLAVCLKAAHQDPDFFGRLLAYNHVKGEVRDAKVALPVIALMALRGTDGWIGDPVYAENALAHLADLRPREFLRALEFAKDIRAPQRVLRRLTERYLRDIESVRPTWNRTALQHRQTLRTLYAKWAYTAPGRAKTKADWTYEKAVLFGTPPPNTVFARLGMLKNLKPDEIAGWIMKDQIPFLIAQGALGARAKETDVVLALIARMSTTELVTNMKWLDRMGVKKVPALRAALEEALGKAATAKKAPKATFKTTRAAEALADDEVLSGKLRVLQEKQIERVATIDGDWLVLGDKSGSMEAAIETAKEVAGVLSRLVKGKVYLVFFDTTPVYYDVTGKTLEDIKGLTSGIKANGGTSIGCGVRYAIDRKFEVDGMAIVSDGCENAAPGFAEEYAAYAKKFDKTPTVYFYQTATAYPAQALAQWRREQLTAHSDGELAAFRASWKRIGLDVQTFDLTGGTDYYALPNLAKTMRVQRYSLMDDIMAMKLRTLDEVLDRTHDLPVLAKAAALVTA